MKWTPVKGSEKYAISLATGRGTYHVSKGFVHGVARYTAWPPKPTASEDRPWQERVHTSLGFERVGVVPSCGWKFGRWLDIVMMQRSLGDGDQTPHEGSA